MPSDDHTTWNEFRNIVDTTAGELEKWRKTDKSKDVGLASLPDGLRT
ncbi:hypothetical protein PT015_01075 [Candidatus Mycobacterium wuenschmannii]|uniref:Uncharacterized protein n=1 Tax=Candidatus Mycobacterium wuenschmannii TaxID=3027808 RepID=A0ABY8W162_9MYCO|nr:hypothetical protein [Candidatus Mycobacterium wuenschmannii]WIM88148.1 hypothetical protein PT015_01075 [Candidatus Mycobacterium wuenschmannii]